MAEKVSIYVASAIAGCFFRESQVNPGIWESLIVPSDTFYHEYQYDGIGGYGFGQFTNVGGSWRCRDYYLWCRSNGYNPDNGTGQMKYITEVEKVWFNKPETRGDYTTIEEFLTSKSENLDDLVWDWLANWEGVTGDAYDIRKEFAYKAFSYIRGHENDSKEDYHWVTGNMYISESDSLNNSLLIYWTLGGYDPGGEPVKPDTKKSKIPLWMMLKPIRH